jgi:DNA-binding NtrC family response regulator
LVPSNSTTQCGSNPEQIEEGARVARILIADDDFEMRQMLTLLAQLRGHHVETVATGDALVTRLLDETQPPPDIVVTDVRMPGRTGLDALATVRPHCPTLPAVVITAFGDHTVHARARDLGARSIDKPFDPDDLLDLVEDLLDAA